MTARGAVAAIVAVTALRAGAQAAPAGKQPSEPKLVPVVEPGKPMRLELVAPASADAPEPCDLDFPQDRRTTPSSRCLRCHDGSRATNAGTGHRFDIEYLPMPGKDLRPDPEKVNAKVVLAAGKVTCLSCHEPLSTATLHLAAPTSGPVPQRLCAACHIR